MGQASHANAAHRHPRAGAAGWPQKRSLRGRDGRLEATTPIALTTLDDNWCQFASVRYSIPNTCYLDQDLNDHQRISLQKRQLLYN